MITDLPNFESAVCTPLAADSWEVAEDEVRLLSTYERDWDGEGADPVPDVLIESTLEWFRGLRRDGPAPVAVSPLAGGTIMLEWHYPNGSVASVEIRQPGRGEVLVWSPHRPKEYSVTCWGAESDAIVTPSGATGHWDGACESPFEVAA